LKLETLDGKLPENKKGVRIVTTCHMKDKRWQIALEVVVAVVLTTNQFKIFILIIVFQLLEIKIVKIEPHLIIFI